MSDPAQVIFSKGANMLVEDARFSPSAVADIAIDALGGAAPGSALVLESFRRHYGGLWVGGRLTLSAQALTFRPNAMNRAVHSGELDLSVPLEEIAATHLEKASITDIICVTVASYVAKFRCFGATDAVGLIRGAAASAAGS